ncbi:hypothetical protein [Loktanella sp. IMCC34160]|uniref:hypothetical protein n=1 Tax=Loktanella sp. IMCC34160 TaxID=2510646 RepID=UPI001F5D823E|nr:hypothetical protein [Loktanella sp. IMCC34160]
MTTQERGRNGEVAEAERKLGEILNVLTSAQTVLAAQITAIEQTEATKTTEVRQALRSLHELYLNFRAAEEKFHEKYGSGLRAGDIDFDAVRAQIGSRLDSLRRARSAGEVSGDPE